MGGGNNTSESPQVTQSLCCWGDAKSLECQKPGMPSESPFQHLHLQPGCLHRAWVVIFTSAAIQTGNVDTDREGMVYITAVLSPSFLSPLT